MRHGFQAVAGVLCLAACGSAQTPAGDYLVQPLTVRSVTPDVWLLGTRVRLDGTGFLTPDVGTMTATIQGRAGERDVTVRVDIAAEGPDRAVFQVTPALLEYLPVDGPALTGQVTVERSGPRGVAASASQSLAVRVVSELAPSILAIEPALAYPGEEVSATGAGFLFAGEGRIAPGSFGPQTGTTWLRLSGRVTAEISEEPVDIAVPLATLDRDRATFRLTPDLLGLGPAVFEGSVEVHNVFSGDAETLDVPGGRLDGVTLRLERAYLSGIAPSPVRRGQELVFEGKGFLPADGGMGTISFVAFTGTESGASRNLVHGRANPLVFVPDVVEDNSIARVVVRTLIGPDQRPTGFGSRPARLTGTFTPHVVFRDQVLVGTGIETTLEVGYTVQVVFLRFLPTFEDGIETFGLRAVSDLVKQRIVEVCRADYQGLAVEFRTERPEDFREYLTVEIMARDPNEAGLLGLDNSFGKDVGNLVLDERLGGYDAQSEEAGYYPYGGVFVESFQYFSPTLATGVASEFASAAFDAVFAPVMPALGGTPAREAEIAEGSPARQAAIREAVRVLGNLLGDTVTHEVGHALGLAAVEGEFHDPGDNPGFIMDAGVFRPFEERAQMPGAYPRVFAPYDRAYLEEILPTH